MLMGMRSVKNGMRGIKEGTSGDKVVEENGAGAYGVGKGAFDIYDNGKAAAGVEAEKKN